MKFEWDESKNVINIQNFEYTQQGFMELQAALKEGKIVRNPFARFYTEKVEVTVIQDTVAAQSNVAV